MRIGVFGDSFATRWMRTHKRYKGHPGFDKIGKPWFEYLPYDVIAFGESGSDIFYSYKLYLENRRNFDKTVFIATAPGRLSVKDRQKEYRHYNSNVIAEIHKTRSSGNEHDFLDSVIRYFKDIQDFDKEIVFWNLIKDDIKKDTNCLLIEGFGDNGLKDIFQMENSIWGVTFKDNHSPNIKDFRYCHMTQENNQILANKIEDCLSNNKQFVFDINDFYRPTLEDKNKYIHNTQEMEEWLNGV